MILDDGICTIFRKENVAVRGMMPKIKYEKVSAHWYGELDFATVPSYPTDGREETQIDLRIRILQDRNISNHDALVLANVESVEDVMIVYEIIRAYHGKDDESGERITDLTLKKVKP